jgi:hypothetical protein
MSTEVICSNCFKDQGLKLVAYKIGKSSNEICQNCKTSDGKKLTKELVEKLAYKFFVIGTIHRCNYGAAPIIQFNTHNHKKTDIRIPEWLQNDIKLIEDIIEMGFFYYGPSLWMVGEVEPLKSLQKTDKRNGIIDSILNKYPIRQISKDEIFFRLRKNPEHPLNYSEYDSPPSKKKNGRLDSLEIQIMYGSQDIEICVHECRVTVNDELFVASLCPTKNLRLLDLTELLHNDNATEFESIDMAVHMLFLAGEHSYEISREIAIAAKKANYDGLIYPSYFSTISTGATPFETRYGISIRRFPLAVKYAKSQIIPNIALFGMPIKEGIVKVTCLNRLVLSQVVYDISFGPALD